MIEDQHVIDLIKEFISEKQIEVKDIVSNIVFRDDVFSILRAYSTVLFYPLREDDIDGCHVYRNISGEIQSVVFINSCRKQVYQNFTAAHELGHIWNLDSFLIDNGIDRQFVSEHLEDIMNRFSAGFMMPFDIFKEKASIGFQKYSFPDVNGKPAIIIKNMLKIIVDLMDYFAVPYEAVVKRLGEVGILDCKNVDYVLSQFSEEVIYDSYVQGSGAQRLMTKPSENKYIGMLSDVVNKAEEHGLVSEGKIYNVRKAFDLPVATENDMDETVTIQPMDVKDDCK